jgi:hypothetical protein
LSGEETLQFTFSFIEIFVVDVTHAAPILLALTFAISIIGLLIGKIEGWSTTNAVYHAFINATTVGYGDFRPTHPASKFLSILMALIGLIFTGLIVAIAVHSANATFAQVSTQATSFLTL